jgi:ubiquinone/menaquinone biosynthesis C-methylase UbiE
MSPSRRSKLSKEVRDTKAYYEKYAEKWAQSHANPFHHEVEFTHFVKLLPLKAKVADIGCASGLLAPLFLGIGRKLSYHGIDISKAFLKIAERRFPQLPFTLGNIAERDTLPKKKFDGFLAVAILMHLPFLEWDTAFENIEHITRPGAIGYVVLPTEHPSGIPHPQDTRHFTTLSEKEQVAYIKKRGWKILKKYEKKSSVGLSVWCGYIVQLPKK